MRKTPSDPEFTAKRKIKIPSTFINTTNKKSRDPNMYE